MNLLLEFADSEVSRVEITEAGLTVHFSAAQVYHLTDVAADSETAGYARGVELLLPGAPVSLPQDLCFGRLADGRIEVNGRWFKRIPLPYQEQGPARLELVFANRSELGVTGTSVECRFKGEPNFTESLFC